MRGRGSWGKRQEKWDLAFGERVTVTGITGAVEVGGSSARETWPVVAMQ